ncbi:MAG: glycosyltransferase [Anaerolineales bacterium]|jgi:lipopolysaccharide/colanic/teichoic acid biosynthesis glycosyltransferase/GT2 family glycosyltransferase
MPLNWPAITVIIPARNASRTLAGCLSALRVQTISQAKYEIIVVDDGSTDATPEVAANHGVRLVRIAAQGPAAARNAGAELARGQLLVFTEADCVPTRDFLERMAGAFIDPDVVAAQGAFLSFQTDLIPLFVQSEQGYQYWRMEAMASINAIDLFAAAFKKSIFLLNRGFDPGFAAGGMEGRELAYRLAQKGYRMVFAPSALVYRRHALTLRPYLSEKFRNSYWRAHLLGWHPKRLMGDSQLSGHRIFQSLLAWLIPVLAPLALLNPRFWVVIAAGLVVFGLGAWQELLLILKRNPALLIIAPWLMFLRALVEGAGLVAGFVDAGREVQREHWTPMSLVDRILKRLQDLILSGLGLLLFLPVLLLSALAIFVETHTRVVSLHLRLGEDGLPFEMVWLEPSLGLVQERLPRFGPAEETPDSPEEPLVGHGRIGGALGRLGIYRLLWLWNVFWGEMSLVGPVPERRENLLHYSDRQRRRFAFRPGVTGPSQILLGENAPLGERLPLELNYADHYSLKSDLQILVRSLLVWRKPRRE